ELHELRVLTRTDAGSEQLAAEAAKGRLFYLVGGDPGHVAQTLRGSRVWEAILSAWQAGAALAGSSAGAMALGEWTLIRARWPDQGFPGGQRSRRLTGAARCLSRNSNRPSSTSASCGSTTPTAAPAGRSSSSTASAAPVTSSGALRCPASRGAIASLLPTCPAS